MTLLSPHAEGIPLPTMTPVSQPFWDACGDGVLLYQRCPGCGRPDLARPRCRRCGGSDLEWAESSGRGEVYSHTVVWRPQSPAFASPYVVAIVQLEEGHFMLANIVGCEAADVTIGLPVRVTFHPIGPEVVLPYFEPLL